MGAYYCNFTLRGPSQEEIVALLQEEGYEAFVSPTVRGRTVVYERESSNLESADVAAVGILLSEKLKCPALAVINADDDELWIGLYLGGVLKKEYSSRGRNRGAYAISSAFGRPWLAPVVWLLLQAPWLLFETFRHALLAKLLGIPVSCAVMGYTYLERGEVPDGVSEDDLKRTVRKR